MALLRVNTPVFDEIFSELNKMTGFNSLMQSIIAVLMYRYKLSEFILTDSDVKEVLSSYDLDIRVDEKTGEYTCELIKFETPEVDGLKAIKGGKN